MTSVHRISLCLGAPLLLGSLLNAQVRELPTLPEVVSVNEVSSNHALTAPVVDLAICLDTSGSMKGLINSAKEKLWAIVNDLALAEPTPRLRVALLTYGNDGHDSERGWVRLDSPLTEDLDLISERLFSLTTNGGTEYVGRVIHASLQQLDWTQDSNSLKLIVVAGNEEADQDPDHDFREVCKAAITRDIIVNSIYCGDAADPIAPLWREVAVRADGHFASIDMDHGTIAIATPFDDQLAALSVDLNTTYIPVGLAGMEGFANQARQDSNAAGLNNQAAAQRAWSKSNGLYNCGWDLVDGCSMGTLKLAEVKDEDLPEEFRGKTLEEKQALLDEAMSRRVALREEIAGLNTQREQFVQQELQRLQLDESQAFDNAVRAAIRDQARAKGFQYDEAATASTASAATSAPTQSGAAENAASVAPATSSAAPAAQSAAPAAQQGVQSLGIGESGQLRFPVPPPPPVTPPTPDGL